MLARERIRSAAVRRALDPMTFATTAVMAVSDGSSTLAAHVGDGAVAVRRVGSAEWTALSWPEQGEFAGTTRFVTDEDGPAVRIALHDMPIDRLAVMTDGLERLALDFWTCTPHAAFLGPMTAPLASSAASGRNARLSEELGRFLDSDAINERTDDDKTLVLASFA